MHAPDIQGAYQRSCDLATYLQLLADRARGTSQRFKPKDDCCIGVAAALAEEFDSHACPAATLDQSLKWAVNNC